MTNVKVIYTILDLTYEIVIPGDFPSNKLIFNIKNIKYIVINQILDNELKINYTDNNSIYINIIRKVLYDNMEIKCIIKEN